MYKRMIRSFPVNGLGKQRDIVTPLAVYDICSISM